MVDRNGIAAAPFSRLCVGPLVNHVDGFAARRGGEGYRPLLSVGDKCELVADLSHWLDRRSVSRE
jgi:hypothetical protein